VAVVFGHREELSLLARAGTSSSRSAATTSTSVSTSFADPREEHGSVRVLWNADRLHRRLDEPRPPEVSRRREARLCGPRRGGHVSAEPSRRARTGRTYGELPVGPRFPANLAPVSTHEPEWTRHGTYTAVHVSTVRHDAVGRSHRETIRSRRLGDSSSRALRSTSPTSVSYTNAATPSGHPSLRPTRKSCTVAFALIRL
jgi:hypothetical protein